MNSINENTISSYTYDYVNNTNIAVQSTENDTSSSNTTTENTATIGDTVEISTDCASNGYSAFIKTVREVSSERGTFQGESCAISDEVAFFTAREIMKDAGYSVPSFDSNDSSYSDFIDKMKGFFSSDSDSFSSNLIDFCDVLKERLNMYGID